MPPVPFSITKGAVTDFLLVPLFFAPLTVLAYALVIILLAALAPAIRTILGLTLGGSVYLLLMSAAAQDKIKR